MKKKVVFTFGIFLLAGSIIWGLINLRSEKNLLILPLTKREEWKFSLNKELVKSGINLSNGPAWNQKTMSFEGRTAEGIRVIFSAQKGAEEQVASLQLLLNKSIMLNNEGKKIKVIDLRALNPYVSYEDNQRR